MESRRKVVRKAYANRMDLPKLHDPDSMDPEIGTREDGLTGRALHFPVLINDCQAKDIMRTRNHGWNN
jgi:hypothetical protein